MTSLTFQVICQFRRFLSNLRISVTIPGPVSAVILGGRSEVYDIIWRVMMAVYLARSCPMCRSYLGIVIGEPKSENSWRLAKVPYYSTNPIHAYLIEERMRQLGRLDRYQKELSKITHAKNIPSEWASPDQRCRAAIKTMGEYGQVIPLNRSRKQ